MKYEEISPTKEDIKLLRACVKRKGEYVAGVSKELENHGILVRKWRQEQEYGSIIYYDASRASSEAEKYLKWYQQKKRARFRRAVLDNLKWLIPAAISAIGLIYSLLGGKAD